MTFEVLAVPSLAALSDVFWESFHQGASVYQSRPWLTFVEQSASPTIAYVAATEAGQGLGLMPVYPVPAVSGSGYALTELIGADAVPGTGWLCGNRRAYRNEMLHTALPATGDRRQRVLNTLVKAAAAGPAASPPMLIFPYVSKDIAEALCQTVPHAVPFLSRLDATIHIDGRSFNEYIRDLGQTKATKARREIRRFERAGYSRRIERLADCWHEAGPLVANVQQRYGHDNTPESCRRGLRRQGELMAPHDVVFTARSAGRLVALSLFYEWNGTLAGRVVGFDYDRLADAMEYFNLTFYWPLEYACSRGLSGIWFGTGSEHAKQRRGARLTGLWTVIAGPDPLPSAVAGTWRERNTRMRERLSAAAPVEEPELSDGWFRE